MYNGKQLASLPTPEKSTKTSQVELKISSQEGCSLATRKCSARMQN